MQSQHQFLVAGAAAGILEHCVMYPFDVIRTRMQSIKPQIAHPSLSNSLRYLIKNERLRTFRGMGVVIAGAGPAHALYFTCYENCKLVFLNDNKISSAARHHNQTYRALAHGLSGCIATLIHDAFMNPVDVIKQRMQMYNSPFETSLSCARHIYSQEGLNAFYRSYLTQLTMNLPYQALHFITYEIMQDLMNKNREFNAKTHIVSGAVAGAIASAVTTPLDVCKTLLNTQEKLALVAVNCDRVTGLASAIRVIYRCCGIRGYFQGIEARVIVAAPSAAISWAVYEFFKSLYGNNQMLEELLRD